MSSLEVTRAMPPLVLYELYALYRANFVGMIFANIAQIIQKCIFYSVSNMQKLPWV